MTAGTAGTKSDISTRSRGFGGGAVLMGALMIVLGILCLVTPAITGMAAIVVLGALLVASGVIELVHGARHKAAQHSGVLTAGGLFSIAVGLVMVLRPGVGLAAMTLLLAAFLLAVGLFTTFTALASRYPGRAWDLTFGIAAILLGVVAIPTWPISALWLVGLLVGVEIIVRGATLVAAGAGLGDTVDARAGVPA